MRVADYECKVKFKKFSKFKDDRFDIKIQTRHSHLKSSFKLMMTHGYEVKFIFMVLTSYLKSAIPKTT